MNGSSFIGAGIGLAVVALIFGLLFLRKPERHLLAMTRRCIRFRTDMPPNVVFEKLIAFAPPRTRLVTRDNQTKRLVFQTNVSFATFGFDFPVFVTPDGAGSNVDVGCTSRSFQWGPLVTQAHKGFVDSLKSYLAA